MDKKNKFHAIDFSKIKIDDMFWKPRMNTNCRSTIPHIYRTLEQGGRFRIYDSDASEEDRDQYKIYWESEIARWIEAASNAIALEYDPELDRMLDRVIGKITSVAQADGYLNAYFTFIRPGERWKHLFSCHELFNAGALIEAAVAHFKATGKRSLLDPIIKFADHICEVFGRGPGKIPGYDGHPEIEMALVTLYRLTGSRKYLDSSYYFVDERGRKPYYFDLDKTDREVEAQWLQNLIRFYKTKNRNLLEYNQSHATVYEQEQAVGHAVRALYLYCAMADLVMELDDEGLMAACKRLWESVCTKKMYITGAVGAETRIEGFGPDFILPNGSAYAETCAAIALVFWNHRMLQMDCDSRYADVIERVMYNTLPAGVSLDGTEFFYENVLSSSGEQARKEGFICGCCPPNVARFFTSIGNYIYSVNMGYTPEIAVHLYMQNKAEINIGGAGIVLRQTTDYPWDGKVSILLEMPSSVFFTIRLRIPGWCRNAVISVNSEPVDIPGRMERGYVPVGREWKNGDRINIEFDMPVEKIHAHPNISEDAGYVAVQRGPVVYCLEEADNGPGLHNICIPETSVLEYHYDRKLLGGVAVVEGDAKRASDSGWGDALYRRQPAKTDECRITAIPYCVWNNREKGQMNVWIRNGGLK